MGWKNLKNHFGIEHLVHVTSKGVHLGVPYIPEMISIAQDGTFTQSYEPLRSSEIAAHIEKIRANPELVRTLLNTPDEFATLLPVFTFDGATIIETRCEAYGYPNVTVAGALMYENRYTPDRAQAIEWARNETRQAVEYYARHLGRVQADLKEAEQQLARAKAEMERLYLQYPEVVGE